LFGIGAAFSIVGCRFLVLVGPRRRINVVMWAPGDFMLIEARRFGDREVPGHERTCVVLTGDA
jgi:hypothetical protein